MFNNLKSAKSGLSYGKVNYSDVAANEQQVIRRGGTVWTDPDTALGWVNRTIAALYEVELELGRPERPAPDVSHLLDMLARAKGCLERGNK